MSVSKEAIRILRFLSFRLQTVSKVLRNENVLLKLRLFVFLIHNRKCEKYHIDLVDLLIGL